MTGLRGDPLYIEAHLGYLFDKALDTGGIVVTSEPTEQGWRSRCFPVGELDQAAQHLAARSDAGANTFVRNNLLAERISPYRRGTKEQTGYVTAFVGDVDIAGPGHQPAADGLPLPNRDHAEAICHALLTPSYVLFSGGGFYPAWRLSEAWDVRDAEARAEYLALDRAWGRSMAEVGRRAGFHVDMVGDGTRVLRSAGTVNHKAGTRPPTRHRPPRPPLRRWRLRHRSAAYRLHRPSHRDQEGDATHPPTDRRGHRVGHVRQPVHAGRRARQ